MRKKFVIPLLFVVVSLLMACSFGYEGLAISDDPEPINLLEDMYLQETINASNSGEASSAQTEETPQPVYQSISPSDSPSTQSIAGAHEYSVNATNFGCTCQVAGNVTTNFNFKENQLEILDASGGAEVYDKISENTYKRTFMGYYIVDSGSGAAVTSTIVEEEKHVIIILTDNGYVMEHYSGEESSPCCYHTFTIQK